LYSATSSSKVAGSSGEGENCAKEGIILRGAFLNNPIDMIHNETSCWTYKEIERMAHDVHLSVAEAWQGCAAHYGM
jgi:hypothetical protein